MRHSFLTVMGLSCILCLVLGREALAQTVVKTTEDLDADRPEAWALNYFLLRQRPKEFQNYIDRLSKKGPLELDEPAERLQEFKASFGSDLAALDNEFLRYMARVK